MTIKNSDMPAMPINKAIDTHESWEDLTAGGRFVPVDGLTKREKFCLEMGVPNTGDPVLDEIIIKGNRNKAAMMAMQGLLSGKVVEGLETQSRELGIQPENIIARMSIEMADALLKELEK